MNQHKQAKESFNNRIGVDYMELASNPEAQKIAKENLDKETTRLRERYSKIPSWDEMTPQERLKYLNEY